MGWQVSAQGLSIDKNFYPKGATVPAGELCGNIDFYADYGFCVYQDSTTVIEDSGVELFTSGQAELLFVDANGSAINLASANVTNTAIANVVKNSTFMASSYTVTATAIGKTNLVASAKSLRDNNYTVKIPITVKEDFVIISATTVDGELGFGNVSEIFKDARKIEIPKLWVSDHEVTKAEYKAIMGSVPSGQAPTYGVEDNNPVNYVSWYNVLVYCNKRSMEEGLTPCYKISNSTNPNDWGIVPISSDVTWNAVICNFDANGYRLPTEAEWEYLARGGQNFKYSGSNNTDDVAWYTSNANSRTHEVKTKNPNAFGLYDMSGNVYEWCWDRYTTNITDSTPGTGPTTGSDRVARGGSYSNSDYYAKVISRDYSAPNYLANNTGFRVVRTLN